MTRLLDVAVAPARCESSAPARSTAARLVAGRSAPPAHLLAEAAAKARHMVDTVGRVVPAGDFTATQLRAQLAASLPGALAQALKERFEWYLCRGAHFHTDAHYGDVLFGAWCVAGPAREIVFSRLQQRCPATPGEWVVFDPFEPHAVLDPGQSRYDPAGYAGAEPSVFIGFEIALTDAVRETAGIGAPPDAGVRLASRVAIHAETGAFDAGASPGR